MEGDGAGAALAAEAPPPTYIRRDTQKGLKKTLVSKKRNGERLEADLSGRQVRHRILCARRRCTSPAPFYRSENFVTEIMRVRREDSNTKVHRKEVL
jgi:hypothetical protein